MNESPAVWPALVSEHFKPVKDLFVISENNGTFTCSYGLISKKGYNACVAHDSGMSAFIKDSKTLCGIFNNPEIVFLCNGKNGIHVACLTIYVNRHDGFCTGRN